MEINLPGARVLVTGGAAGIGRHIAKAFGEAGAHVYVCDVSAEGLAQLVADNPSMTTSRTDVSDQKALDVMFADIVSRMGGLDVIVNNAGISGPNAAIDEVPADEWERVFAVNVHGTFYCTQRAIPLLKAAGEGSIINISSVAGRLPYAFRSPYSSSKFALVGFTQCLALELGAYNIRANAILPGLVRGDRWLGNAARRAARDGIPLDEVVSASLSRVATGKMIEPDEIAETAVFLASRSGRNITGQAISVCGYVQALTGPALRQE
jgi:NAD(P)-dependent dehydrogenase (short-subunit alcohol dehydrogenase family)